MPGTPSSAGGDVVAVGAGVEHERPSATRGGQLDDRATAAARHRQRRRVERGERVRRREHVGDGAVGDRRAASPAVATMRPATVRAPATETCWPTTARTAVSNGSTLPGTRRPGIAATSGRERRVVGQRVVDGDRVGVEVEQRAARAARPAPRSRQSASRRRSVTPARSSADGARPAPARRRRGRGAGRARGGTHVPSQCLDAGHGAGGEERQRGARRRTARAPARWSSTPPAVPSRSRAGRGPQLPTAWSANTSRTVSLNWRTLPKPAANAIAGEVEIGRLDERAGGAGPLGAGDGERAGAELVGHRGG